VTRDEQRRQCSRLGAENKVEDVIDKAKIALYRKQSPESLFFAKQSEWERGQP